MRHLLVASDLSARADRAVARALDLARQHEASLTVLSVVDDELPDAAAEPLRAAARNELSSLLSHLECAGDSRVSVRVVTGGIHESIIEQAVETGADLIVLGIHRNEASRLPVIGSTLSRVVRECPTPMLMVKGPAGEPYRNVMVGVDFSEFTPAAIMGAASLAPEGAIHLVHAYHVPFSGFLSGRGSTEEIREKHELELDRLARQQMEALTKTDGPAGTLARTFRSHLIEGEVNAVLRRQVAELNVELISLGTHGTTGLARAWLGSVAEDFLIHPPCDVLVTKAE